MAKNERELIARPAINARLVACQCTPCNWHASVEYSASESAGEAARKAFDSHHCEAYGRSDPAVMQ